MNEILRPSPDALIGLLKDIPGVLTPLPFVRKILCFGSMARGTWDCWSDIDLIVVTDTRAEFLTVLERLEQTMPVLHRNHFVSQVEPCGGHILGIIFQGMSVFHNVDLNLLTCEEAQTAGALERFGQTKELYAAGPGVAPTDSADIPSEQEDPDEAQLKVGIHFTKKAAKKILRETPIYEDLLHHSAALKEAMNEYPALSGKPIGLLAQAYIEIAERLLASR